MPEWAIYAIAIYLGVHWAYVLVMGAKARLKTLTKYWIAILLLPAIVGLVLDVLFQFTFGWVMFLETPFRGGLMFSGRVQHHYRHSDGWRRRLAGWWARQLNVFDENHIRP